jgi:ABC-type transport system involved in multi-copper enzyme maturation permease subunit
MKTYARIFMVLGVLLWIVALLAFPRVLKSIIVFILGAGVIGTAYALAREQFESKKPSFTSHKKTLTSGEYSSGESKVAEEETQQQEIA